VKKNIFYLVVTVLLFSCENTPETKGDLIPPIKVIDNPINYSKSINYLTALLEDNEKPAWYFLRAKAYFELHDYLKALQDINKALKGGSADLDYIYLSASIKYNLEWYDSALEDLNVLSRMDFDPIPINLLFVQIYLAKNDFRRARFFLSKLDTFGFSKNNSLLSRVLHRRCMGDTIELANDLNFILRIEDQHDLVVRTYFEYFKPKIYTDEFTQKIILAIKKYPFDPHLMRFWARFSNSIFRFDRAEKVYIQLEKLLPQNPLLLFEIGEFYFKIRNYRQAFVYFSKISSSSNNYSQALLMKAICLLYLGNRDQSLMLLDSARMVSPKDGNLVKRYYSFTSHIWARNKSNNDSLIREKLSN
jgi:tetratricopeptide (TPR) repeat protein